MSAKVCPDCGGEVGRQATRCKPCSRIALAETNRARGPAIAEANRRRAAARRAALIEDVEFLLSTREAPERIAKRVGYASLEAIQRQLHRTGRHDLAARVRLSRATDGGSVMTTCTAPDCDRNVHKDGLCLLCWQACHEDRESPIDISRRPYIIRGGVRYWLEQGVSA